MFALRPLAIGVLALTSVACSIDKSPSPPPQRTENPPAQEKPKRAEAPTDRPKTKAQEVIESINDARRRAAEIAEGKRDEVPRRKLSAQEQFAENVFGGEYDSEDPAQAMSSSRKAEGTRMQQKLVRQMSKVKTAGEQKFLAALAQNDLLIYGKYPEANYGGGIFSLFVNADKDRVSLARALIDAGITANIDLPDSYGNTPLSLANSNAMIELLFPFTSPTLRNKDGQTALIYRLSFVNDVWPILLKKTCEYGGFFDSLLHREPPINATDSKGQTALHYAAQRGLLVATNMILDCPGAKLFIKSTSGQTPLHIAAGSMHAANATSQALIAAAKQRVTPLSAFLDAQDDAGDTALHIAFRCENKALIHLYTYFGARTDLKNKKGETALEQTSYECPSE